ncbi:MAG: GGDEF domain-containing protein, partial [Pseudomonadota bacterium]|nr:GGDEF domain-containing protein [Pseudomonadota bacterium]
TLRVSDIAGRYGGEEFAVVLPETALAQALSVAERFRESLAAATLVGPDGPLAVSASLGVAQYKSGMDGPESLLRLADEALYLAKRRGRNRVQAAVRST